MDTTTLLIIVLLVLLFAGGGWYGRGRWLISSWQGAGQFCSIAMS
jgi:hypothetical protein